MHIYVKLPVLQLCLTALSLGDHMTEILYSERPATLILHRPRANAVYSLPCYHLIKSANSTFQQNKAKYIVFGINEKLSMRRGLKRLATGDNGW